MNNKFMNAGAFASLLLEFVNNVEHIVKEQRKELSANEVLREGYLLGKENMCFELVDYMNAILRGDFSDD